MKNGGFQYGEHFIEWNNILQVEEGDHNIINYGLKIKNKKKKKMVVYEKEWLFNCYDKQTYNSRKFDNSSFWREMEKHCICDLYKENRIQINKQRKIFVFLPSLEDARKKWNEKQQYDYNYDVDEDDEWDVDCYDKQTYNSRKFDNSSFWREMEKHCICDLYKENRIQINKQRKIFVFLPSLEDARKKWNEKQQYDYNYDVDEDDEWDVDDCDIDSSDDE